MTTAATNRHMVEPIWFTIPVNVPELAQMAPMYGNVYLPYFDLHDIDYRKALVVVLGAGGSYDGNYWDLIVPGYPRYAFSVAHELRQFGFIVITLDHLGTGKSARPDDGNVLTLELMAHADALATQEIVRRVRDGTFIEALASPFSQVDVVRFGHSMGAVIGILEQGMWPFYRGLGVLGWSMKNTEQIAEALGRLAAMLPVKNGYALPQDARPVFRPYFYAPDVPAEVIAADEAAASVVPIAGLQGGSSSPRELLLRIKNHAQHLTCPLFLGFGELEASLSGDALVEEVGVYEAARFAGITFYELRGSAHCHAFATQRIQMSRAMGNWVRMISEEWQPKR